MKQSIMNNRQKVYLFFLFLIAPLSGVVKLFKIKDEKTILLYCTLFFGLLGSVFIYVNGTDGNTHLMNAKSNYLNMTFTDFISKSISIISFKETDGISDIYLHTLSYLAAAVFQYPALIHVFGGFVLGYFFVKSVLLLLKDYLLTKKSIILIGFITLFLSIKSIEALNSLRMWTGMWVLFYGVYSYAVTKKIKFLFVILFATVIHFSYLIILIPIITFFSLRKFKKFLVGLYIMSFIISVDIVSLKGFLPQIALFESRQNTYAIDSEEKEERFEEMADNYESELKKSNFYKAIGPTLYNNYSIVGIFVLMLYFYLKVEADEVLDSLIAVGTGLYIFANLISFSPELVGRTKIIAATFVLGSAIHFQLRLMQRVVSEKKIRKLNICFAFFLMSAVPIFMFQIADVFQNVSVFILLFPEISWLLGDNDISIRGIIGLIGS